MKITKDHLPANEYYTSNIEKNSFVLHHTAGSHRPDWVIYSWDKDKTKGGKVRRVGTHFVIGGKSTRDGNSEWDGKILEAIPLDCWAHHLGTRNSNNTILNAQSIGIEICNYGPLTKTARGEYYTYVNTPVPESDVIDLGKNWRGYRYYHNYTPKQIESVAFLLQIFSDEYGIDLRKGIPQLFDDVVNVDSFAVLVLQKFLNDKGYLGMDGKSLVEDGINGRNTKYAKHLYLTNPRGEWDAFEYQELANDGGSGIWSHTNYRKDKFDVYPHPDLIDLLKSF